MKVNLFYCVFTRHYVKFSKIERNIVNNRQQKLRAVNSQRNIINASQELSGYYQIAS